MHCILILRDTWIEIWKYFWNGRTKTQGYNFFNKLKYGKCAMLLNPLDSLSYEILSKTTSDGSTSVLPNFKIEL